MLYSFIFIWQTTLSKRHLNRKFHGMFVPLAATKPCRIISFRAVNSCIYRAQSLINHAAGTMRLRGVRAKPFCALFPAPSVCIQF